MRVAILTSGRFHVLDLARELDALGHDVRFHSLVPPWRTKDFGLPARCNRWLGPYVAPAYGLQRLLQKTRVGALDELGDRVLLEAIDRAACLALEPCDVLIAMSGMSLRVLDHARKRFGARIFLERGSRHIRSQAAILADIARRGAPVRPVPEWIIAREEAGYAAADQIVVPALHVERSFAEHGIGPDSGRLFRNPYGTSLASFPPTPAPDRSARDGQKRRVIMVGGWSYRKGVDVLVEAMAHVRDAELVHVGGVIDAPRATAPNVVHKGFVAQKDLTREYAAADVFVLASREEGLAVVQVQALASGLPIVCTDRTGGEDLAAFATPGAVSVVPSDDARALAAALEAALDRATETPPGTPRDLLGARRADVAWSGYAARWHQHLMEIA